MLALTDVEVAALADNAGFRIVEREIFDCFRIWFGRLQDLIMDMPSYGIILKKPCERKGKMLVFQ